VRAERKGGLYHLRKERGRRGHPQGGEKKDHKREGISLRGKKKGKVLAASGKDEAEEKRYGRSWEKGSVLRERKRGEKRKTCPFPSLLERRKESSGPLRSWRKGGEKLGKKAAPFAKEKKRRRGSLYSSLSEGKKKKGREDEEKRGFNLRKGEVALSWRRRKRSEGEKKKRVFSGKGEEKES